MGGLRTITNHHVYDGIHVRVPYITIFPFRPSTFFEYNFYDFHITMITAVSTLSGCGDSIEVTIFGRKDIMIVIKWANN